MWKIQSPAKGSLLHREGKSGGDVLINAAGGASPIELHIGKHCLQFAPVDTDKLPTCDEQFVRGHRWQLNYPQEDSAYGLRLSFEKIPTSGDALVIECCLSVQTDWLDSHPKVDFVLDGLTEIVSDNVNDHGSARIQRMGTQDSSVAILLGPHDYPHTTTLSSPGKTSLRLFGEFLEKGVIRRARPWVVIGNQSDEQLIRLWDHLADSPLPLD
jgi:hypothetical protein